MVPKLTYVFYRMPIKACGSRQDGQTAEGTVFQEHRNRTVAKSEKQGSLRPAAADPVVKRKRTTLYPAAGQVETPGRKRMHQARGRAQGPG